jgi:uncharacterized protein (TIGR02271 family)
MARMEIPQHAQVEAADGALGRVRHVVVDPQTQDLTDLVVEQDGRQWLVPASAVAGVEGERVRLAGDRTQYQRQPADLTAFEVLPGEPAAPGAARPFRVQRRPHRLQLKEEVLRVRTTAEQSGVVRVSTRVTERMETVTVPVRVTRLVIEVVPGSGSARVGDRVLPEGESIEVLLSEERVSVTKELVAREDVLIRTDVVEQEQRIQETVRREELVIDQDGDLTVEDAGAGAE